MFSLLIAAQLMANPCMIVHKHTAHHTPQQSVVCPIMPPCGKEKDYGDITPLYPVPYGYLHMLDMPEAPLDTPAVGYWLAPGWQAPVVGGSVPITQSPPSAVHATPELGLPAWFCAATILIGICLCIHGTRRNV
jgi:hypothetical protein